jgi:hypothetical protein
MMEILPSSRMDSFTIIQFKLISDIVVASLVSKSNNNSIIATPE